MPTQNHFNRLAILANENWLSNKIDLKEAIRYFVKKKSRKNILIYVQTSYIELVFYVICCLEIIICTNLVFNLKKS